METMQDGASLGLEGVCSRLGLLPATVVQVSEQPWRYYNKFDRRKRSGGLRTISASQGKLKWIQRTLLDGVLAQFVMPPHVHGCVKGRSASTNAKVHVDQDVVINIDLSDFFGSVSLNMVTDLLIRIFHFDESSAETFARICVNDGVLPQGAPTSPALANLAALPLDEAIIRTCESAVAKDAFRYSRYVDDITISGGAELVDLVPRILEVVWESGFTPNVDKTRILRRSTRQTVTGLVVNKNATVSRSLLRKIRQQLHYCHKWGIKEHCETVGMRPDRFLKQIKGTIGYVGTVRPDLATELSLELAIAEVEFKETGDEATLRVLKEMIDNENIAEFKHMDFFDFRFRPERVVVAPVSVGADPEGQPMLRAFQLKPEQGWRYFHIANIHRLKVAEPAQ